MIIKLERKASYYHLTGEVAALWKNRRARFFLRDLLDADYKSDHEEINIPFDDQNEDQVIIYINDLFKKFDINGELNQEAKGSWANFEQEEADFEKFSKRARAIRDNDHLSDELEYFEMALAQGFKRKLYPLQLLSAYHLTYAQNGCNFSVPGAGKTSIVYAAYSALKQKTDNPNKYVDHLLVVGPLSSFGPWEEEYSECFGFPVVSKRLSGLSQKERQDYFFSERTCELTLMSYQGLASSFDDVQRFLQKHPTMVVLDEAHRIKNTEGGIWARSALDLAPYAKARVILTGTPAPNGYQDLFNLFRFIWPSKDIIKFKLFQLQDMTATQQDSRVDQLITNISPFFLRIKKSHLTRLPKVNEHPTKTIEMGPIQRQIYEFIENSYMSYFSKHREQVGQMDVLVRARLIRLMQAATNPALLVKPLTDFSHDLSSESEFHTGSFNDRSILEFSGHSMPRTNTKEATDQITGDLNIEEPELELVKSNFINDFNIYKQIIRYKELETPTKFIEAYLLIDEIVNIRQEKVIVWTTFVQNIHDLQHFLQTKGIRAEALFGGIPVASEADSVDLSTREGIIKSFHSSDPPFKVIIANPFAVGESISLHKACNNAIYLERTFNAAHFVQSKDRIHRVGGNPNIPVNYYYLLSNNSIDLTIHERLLIKEQRMIEIMEKMPIPLFEENLDFESDYSSDIKALLNDYYDRKTK